MLLVMKVKLFLSRKLKSNKWTLTNIYLFCVCDEIKWICWILHAYMSVKNRLLLRLMLDRLLNLLLDKNLWKPKEAFSKLTFGFNSWQECTSQPIKLTLACTDSYVDFVKAFLSSTATINTLICRKMSFTVCQLKPGLQLIFKTCWLTCGKPVTLLQIGESVNSCGNGFEPSW